MSRSPAGRTGSSSADSWRAATCHAAPLELSPPDDHSARDDLAFTPDGATLVFRNERVSPVNNDLFAAPVLHAPRPSAPPSAR